MTRSVARRSSNRPSNCDRYSVALAAVHSFIHREIGVVIETEARPYRAVFISDVHLGTRGCQADLLLDFLRHHESDFLYLVGDVVDGWRLKRAWYWPQAHNDVV